MALTTSTDVANLALTNLGIGTAISSIGDTTDPAAVAASRWYDVVRQGALKAWRWRFATKRAVLAELVNVTRDAWGHVYDLPTDLLVARYLEDGTRDDMHQADGRVPYELEYETTAAHPQKLVLLCDVVSTATAPRLVYTWDQTNVAQWPLNFAEAVAWQLAAKLALPLSIAADRAKLAADFARGALLDLIAVEQQALQKDVPPDSEFITSR